MSKKQINKERDIIGNSILSWNPISLIKTLKPTIMVQAIIREIIIQGEIGMIR